MSVSKTLDYQHLVVKNPSNNGSDYDLLRVVKHLSKFLNFDMDTMTYQFEEGKQNQKHIHCIIKKIRVLSSDEISKVHSKFKSRPIIYDVETYDDNQKAVLLTYKIDPKKYVWYIKKVDNQEHLENLKEYIIKEKINFIDSD